MSKTVVVVPFFNDAHFMPMWFDNCVETWEPSHIIFNEGLFPCGMEGGGPYEQDYYDRFTKEGRSLDMELFLGRLDECCGRHPGVVCSVNIIRHSGDLGKCFTTALNYGLPDMSPEDVVVRGELDTFYHEDDRAEIRDNISKLEGDQGLILPMRRFFVSPAVGMDQERIQAQAVKWGTGKLWYTYFNMCHHGLYEGKFERLWHHAECPQYHYEWVRPKTDLIDYFDNKVWQIKLRRLDKIEGYYKARDIIEANGKIGPDGFSLTREGKLFDCPEINHPASFKNHVSYTKFCINRKNIL